MNSDKKQEFTRRICQANATGCTCILFEMILEYCKDAKEALSEEKTSFHKSLHYADQCMHQLILAVDLSLETGQNLFQIYQFIRKEILKADVKETMQPIENAERILLRLLETYELVHEKDSSEALMEHTEVLYTGLTYGSSGLSNSTARIGEQRGFFA